MHKKSVFKSIGFLSALVLGSLSNTSSANDYALTISPLHLFSPIVEVTLESPLAENLSVAGILGYGSVTVDDVNEKIKFSVFEAGAQFRYYTGGDMNRGFQIGVEGLYIKPFFDDNTSDVVVKVNGFALGPFVGYKWNTSSGIIYDLQVGYQRLFAQAKAKDSFGNELDSSVSDDVTLLNMNVGFSF